MNKLISIIALFICFSLTSCKANEVDQIRPTQEAKSEVITPQITTPVEKTDGNDTIGENKKEPESNSDFESEYKEFLGTWYVVAGEIEDDEWTAVEVGDHTTVTFYENYTADYINMFDFWEEPACYIACPVEKRIVEDGWELYVDTHRDDCKQSFVLTEDGTLIEYDEIAYDGIFCTISIRRFSRIEPDFPVYIPPIVPEEIQAYIDNCPENCRMVAIANPSVDLHNKLDEAGFELADESDNEWIEEFERPMEIILANASDMRVMIEVHEPASDYDTKSDESGWDAGPFLYYADLGPGELYRFVIDTPEKAIDAKYAIYMVFYEEGTDYDTVTRKYYIRVYEYDHSFPYFSFDEFQ